VTEENKYADIYGVMNLLVEAVKSRTPDEVMFGIEEWLNEPDQDSPDFIEALAQGVQDAVTHAMSINDGSTTITIMKPGESMIRFELLESGEPSKVFDQAVLGAVKRALQEGRE